MDTIYDVVVVGNGMFGAAATRHLSARGLRLVAVGPDEPADWKTHDGVFSSHYDQGRITRVIDADPVSAQLAQRSIAVYPELETQSGVTFHHRSGGVWIYPQVPAALARLQPADAVGLTFGAEFDRLTDKNVIARFPFLQVPSDAIMLWERGAAGHIDPRADLPAETFAARWQ